MPKEHEKIKYLPGEKSLKVTFIVYADLECLLKKVRSCQNNSENPYTEKKKLSTDLQDTHGVQYARLMRQVEKFCKDLKDLGTEIINFKEKEMVPLTNKEIKSYERQ